MSKINNLIVIAGGMGPMASMLLHKMILENTPTDGTDQSHLNIIHISLPSKIVDRTEYLLNNTLENPALGMFNSIKDILTVYSPKYYTIILAIPCITFYSQQIFPALTKLINKNFTNIKTTNIVGEIFMFLKTHYPYVKRVGLLSTEGTRISNVFDEIAKLHKISIVYPNNENQEKLNDVIFNPVFGLKSKSILTNKASNLLDTCINNLLIDRVDIIILGCTELCIINKTLIHNIPIINPLQILSKVIIGLAYETIE